jgi:hypothetical protein
MSSETSCHCCTGSSRPSRLEAYDSARFGPLFAVSDEGSAGELVVDAAYASAKATAIPAIDPLVLGVILDGERMTSAGEVPIGPEEFKALSAAAKGRIPCTTNVGVRVNTRLTQSLPEFAVDALAAEPSGYESVYETFSPFLHTPDGRPRPLNVRLTFGPQGDFDRLLKVIETLEAGRQRGKLGPPGMHRFSAMIVFKELIASEAQTQRIRGLIDASAKAGLTEVAVDGELRDAARKRLGMQTLLNILDNDDLRRLLKYAHDAGVALVYRYQLDLESAARTIWTGLHVARVNGFAAGKYGLVPMTLEEQRTTIELLTRWTEGWTAIPAFYVDTPMVTTDDVYDGSRMADAARLWLKAAREAGATLALFDSPDRINPHRLLKKDGGADDIGVLSLDEVEDIVTYAGDLGVRVLWSGGITARQAFDLSKRRVFGIFSTSSTAAKNAVTAQFESDPRLPAENEPTEFGVRRIHALVQAGFLSTAVKRHDEGLASSIEERALQLLAAEQNASQSGIALKSLDAELVRGWRTQLDVSVGPGTLATRQRREPFPVPADSVRVFRGTRLPGLSHEELVHKLETVFMPTTVQVQRLYGLTAYLPAVLPPNHGNGVPDEVALVFYRTQGAYHEAKRCVGGRCYSELHELVFDMQKSASSFPRLFTGTVNESQPYHLFEKSVDWQLGSTYLYVGRRRQGVNTSVLAARVRDEAVALQRSPGGIDGAIFWVTAQSLLWWVHAAEPGGEADPFPEVTEVVFSGAPRLARVPPSLTVPYTGLPLHSTGDFVNMQFLRQFEK